MVGKLVSGPLPLLPNLASALTGSGKTSYKIAPDENPVFTLKPPQKGQFVKPKFGAVTFILRIHPQESQIFIP